MPWHTQKHFTQINTCSSALEHHTLLQVASAMLLPAGQRVTALARAVEEAGARLGAAQHALEAAIAR